MLNIQYKDPSDVSLQEIVPLVLHRVVKSMTEDWGDVHVDILLEMVLRIKDRWAVLHDNGVPDTAGWILTFDDGYLSDYEIVFPLLLEYGVSATFFLITSRIGQPGFLSWDQIEEMHRYGMSLGSHSVSHSPMTSLSYDDAETEFKNSKSILEDRLGGQIHSFSYPEGACSKRLHEIGLGCGYNYLFTSKHGVASRQSNVLPRNSIHSGMGLNDVLSVMSPNKKMKFLWFLEELFKEPVKNIIGYGNYDQLRDFVLKNK